MLNKKQLLKSPPQHEKLLIYDWELEPWVLSFLLIKKLLYRRNCV